MFTLPDKNTSEFGRTKVWMKVKIGGGVMVWVWVRAAGFGFWFRLGTWGVGARV